MNPRIEGDTSLTTIILQELGVLNKEHSVTGLRNQRGWNGELCNQTGNILGLPTSFGADITVDVYQRRDKTGGGSWDVYLQIGGETGLEMMTTPVQENPFLQNIPKVDPMTSQV